MVCSATVGCAVAERVRGERRLLHLAGLSKITYWFANALWDTAVRERERERENDY